MPNWCSNSITVTGDEAATNRLLREMPAFDFDAVIPRPEELGWTVTGLCTIDGEQVRLWWGDEAPEELRGTAVTSEQWSRMVTQYGSADWYSWGLTNWGTKWQISPETWRMIDSGLRVCFDTAWSPPTPVIVAFVERFPELTITHAYCERGSDYAGVARYEKRVVTETEFKPSEHMRYDEERDESILDTFLADFLRRYELGLGG